MDLRYNPEVIMYVFTPLFIIVFIFLLLYRDVIMGPLARIVAVAC